MIVTGIDCGAKSVKALLFDGENILGKGSVFSGFDQRSSAEEALNSALNAAGLKRKDIQYTTVTGTGKDEVAFAQFSITEVGADARAMHRLFPSVRTIIDVGAEEGRAIRINESGKVIDFAVNEKCAAGAGTFTETMARALEVDLEDMGELSLHSEKSVPMNAQCAVFAESEVVSLIHARHAKEDIARAVHDAIADRIASMVRKIGMEKDLALVGGVSNNRGFVQSLQNSLGIELVIPENPEFSCALGAALMAFEKAQGGH